MRNGILYRRFYSTDGTVSHLQLIVPRVLRDTFLKLVHEGAGGHFAIRRTQDQVQRRAYWPGWRQSVECYIRRCLTCAQCQASKPKRQGSLQSFGANGPADRYCIDLVGPYPRTKRGKKYILTVLDAYTRHLTTIALAEKSAPVVARALVNEVFMKLGYPRSLLSDLGTEFQNQILDGICRLMGVHKLKTTVHRPSANGRCERSHHTISACLAKLVATNQTDWDEHLPMVTFAMNCAKNETTNYSPFQLMYGRLARMPVDMVLDLPDETYPSDMDDYVMEFAERTRRANLLVQKHSRTSFERMKKNYDAKVRETTYVPGQYVMFFYPRRYKGRSPKLSRPNVGPFRVLQRLNSVNYIIAMTPKSRRFIVHADKLKLWTGEVPKCWQGAELMTDEPLARNVGNVEPPTEPIVPDLRELFDGKVEGNATNAPCDQPDTPGESSTEAGGARSTSRRSRLPVPITRSKLGNCCEETVESETTVLSEAKHDMFGNDGRSSSEVHQNAQPNRILRPSRHIRRPARYRN